MNRQLNSECVKGKREKFASSRTSLSETWDQSVCDDRRIPGYPDLPSPTIGNISKEIAINRLGSQYILPGSNVYPNQVTPNNSQTGNDQSRFPTQFFPTSLNKTAAHPSVWRRHVAIQCNILQPPQRIFEVKPGTHEVQGSELRTNHRCLAYYNGATYRRATRVGESRQLSKSLDWDQFPRSHHSPFWELPSQVSKKTLEQQVESRRDIADIRHGCFCNAAHSFEPNVEKAQKDEYLLQGSLFSAEDKSEHIVSCRNCSGPILSNFEEYVSYSTQKITGAGVSDPPHLRAESSTFVPETQVKLKSLDQRPATESIQPRSPRPSLSFTLPIPDLTQTESEKLKACSSHQGSANEKQAKVVEGRGKSSTLPTIDNKHIVAIRNAEKRRRFFARKQTNSAPDSFEASSFFHVSTQGVINTTRRICGNCKGPVTNCLDVVLRGNKRDRADLAAAIPTVEVFETEIRTARCGNLSVTHVSELDYPDADPPCHFCCEQASTAIHDESRLQIVSGGLVRSRDGSARSGASPYINLPSPNVQAGNEAGGVAFGSIDFSGSISHGQHSPTAHQSGHHTPEMDNSTASRASSIYVASSPPGNKVNEEFVGPSVSSLTRRPALVPPKIMSDVDYDHENQRNNCGGLIDNTGTRARRSSMVVIPPMQICPGDLLVYGKVLSQRKSLLGTPIESSSPAQGMFEHETSSTRKGKASWSLFKLFERGGRAKAAETGTLEDVMSIIQPCDFSDPKLMRFKGMSWTDFVNFVSNSKADNSITSSQEDEELLLPRITGSLTEPKLIPGQTSTTVGSSSELNSSEACDSSRAISMGTTSTAGEMQTSPTTVAATEAISKSNPKKVEQNVKPLVRKRMGLMRTMSDRCLERKITPSFWRASPGFLNEKVVEGKETESFEAKTERSAIAALGSKVCPVAISTMCQRTDSVQQSTKPSENAENPKRQKLRQKEALWDLFQSESSFLYDHLMVLKNVFFEPLKRIQVEGFAMYAEPELLFGNLDELCCVTYGFCKEFVHLLFKLTSATDDLSTTEVLGKLFESSSKARAMSQAYHRYALNYINALNYLETLRRHSEFEEFEKFCMRDPRCKKLQLTDLLVSPVQHIMKIPLILKDIQSRTNQPKEKELIAQILELQETSIRELDDKMKWLKNFERLLEIQRNIVWPSVLEMEPKTWIPEFLRTALGRQPCDSLVVSPRRQIVHEGLLQLWDTGKPMEAYVILFDDMLLITRRKKGLSKKKSSLTENWTSSCGKNQGVGSGLEPNHRYIVYRQPISLDRFFIHDIGDAENTTAKLDSSFVLVSLNRFQQIISVHTFQAATDAFKNVWLQKLKTTQDKWKRTLQNTVFRGVRNSTDSTQSTVASTLLGKITKPFLSRET